MKPDKRRWVVCGLLFLATLINYLDRQTISVSASHIAEEMHLNDGDLGKLFSAFLFAYGIAQIVVGPFLDRMGVIVAYAIAVTAWSLAGASSALTTGFATLFGARLLLGLCESPNWPLALRVVGRVFPPQEKALASGLFQSGTSIGALIAPPIIIWLTITYNWRASFVVMGAVGLLWSALWLAWFRWQPMESLAAPVRAEPGVARAGVRDILRNRAFWGLLAANSLISPLQYFYTTWLARYFDKYAGVGFGKELAGRLVVIYLALDIGLWSGGALVAFLARRMPVRRARLIVTTVGGLSMAAIPAVSQIHDLNVITGLICLATFGLGWFLVNYFSFLSEVAPARTSTVAGFSGGFGSLTGAFFVWLVGYSVDATGGFAAAFLMAGIMPLLALAGMWIGPGSIKPEANAA